MRWYWWRATGADVQARDPAPDLAALYREALQDYIDDGGEAPLHRAYELGRQALTSGIGLLGLVDIHQTAAGELLTQRPTDPSLVARKLRAAGHFLLESLSPFEMLQLGHQESNAALRRLNEILEEEARRIAHTLHDEAAQLLASVYLELAEILHEGPPGAVRTRVERISTHLDQVREQLRRLSHELRPPILDQLGLMPALQFLADGFRKRYDLDVGVENLTTQGGRFTQPIETALYRAVQEALNNVARHAQAKNAKVRVWTEDHIVYCSIRDDGVGFPPAAGDGESAPRGLGLLGIQERVGSLHGFFKIESSPGSGTELYISIPLGSDS